MNIAIIQYNAGNIRSVLFALERIGATALVTADHEKIRAADKVIFPGVGAASSAMQSLREARLDRLIPGLKQPVLGICVGMQLLAAHSEEEDTTCLGIIDGTVKKFMPADPHLKVPQVGWNNIYSLRSPLMKDVKENSFCYFVHSYYLPDNPFSVATTDYVQPYCSALQKDNFYGVQFHAEKSASAGEQILQNFLNL